MKLSLNLVVQYCGRVIRAKISASNREEGETPRLFTPSESTTSSKRSVLRKKLRAEKLALELKMAQQTFANEIECLRAEQQKRAKLLDFKRKLKNEDWNMSSKMPSPRKKVCQIKVILMK